MPRGCGSFTSSGRRSADCSGMSSTSPAARRSEAMRSASSATPARAGHAPTRFSPSCRAGSRWASHACRCRAIRASPMRARSSPPSHCAASWRRMWCTATVPRAGSMVERRRSSAPGGATSPPTRLMAAASTTSPGVPSIRSIWRSSGCSNAPQTCSCLRAASSPGASRPLSATNRGRTTASSSTACPTRNSSRSTTARRPSTSSISGSCARPRASTR